MHALIIFANSPLPDGLVKTKKSFHATVPLMHECDLSPPTGFSLLGPSPSLRPVPWICFSPYPTPLLHPSYPSSPVFICSFTEMFYLLGSLSYGTFCTLQLHGPGSLPSGGGGEWRGQEGKLGKQFLQEKEGAASRVPLF
jgi:hypothetical protein